MPTGQVTENCHYISRMLTKPWEADQRRLHFYDFDTDAWDDGASRYLFSGDRLNAQHVEDWLGRIIEGPLQRSRELPRGCS
ncbi:MAG: hypothetical protein HS111_14585 [Kofleriaceae bacterium]|nr:hypothetical protein [Kofleriaceae bacterium]MCL4225459.1 hypothetical protein [Myxococcales bacterium]